MIDWIPIAAGLGGGVVGLGIGMLWTHSLARRQAALEVDYVRSGAERKVSEQKREVNALRAELERLHADAAISLSGSRATDPAPIRATSRALERFPARLRGLATVHDAVVIRADGLPQTPCDDAGLLRAGTLIADLAPLVDRQLAGFIDLTVQIHGGDPVCMRRLPSWTDGGWLAVRGRGGAVNPLALDGAIAGAYSDQRQASRTISLTGHTTPPSDNLLHQMAESEVTSGAFDAVALINDDSMAAFASADGPDLQLMARLASGLRYLEMRARWWCGDVVGLRLANPLGQWVALVPGSGGHIVVVGHGPTMDELAIERLKGRLRRLGPITSDPGELAS